MAEPSRLKAVGVSTIVGFSPAMTSGITDIAEPNPSPAAYPYLIIAVPPPVTVVGTSMPSMNGGCKPKICYYFGYYRTRRQKVIGRCICYYFWLRIVYLF